MVADIFQAFALALLLVAALLLTVTSPALWFVRVMDNRWRLNMVRLTRDQKTGGLLHSTRQTHTYATLEVAPETFADVRKRLESAGVLGDYLGAEGVPPAEILVFGTVALRAEGARNENNRV